MRSLKLVFLFLILAVLKVSAQHEEQTYVPDPNPHIQYRIDEWQDIEFVLLMHWGSYSQCGIVESWSICFGLMEDEFRNRQLLPVKLLRFGDSGLKKFLTRI